MYTYVNLTYNSTVRVFVTLLLLNAWTDLNEILYVYFNELLDDLKYN